MPKNNAKYNKNSSQKKQGQRTGFSVTKAKKPQGELLRAALSMASRSINSRPVRNALGSVKMSSCAAKLAAAIADPFSEQATGACFPIFPAPDSHKVQAFARFDGTIGTAGVGIVALTPSVANNTASAYCSSATWAGNSLFLLTATDTLSTGIFRVNHNGPYSAEQLVRSSNTPEADLSGRIVAVGARVTYTGTSLNESGVCTMLTHPTHGNLTGATIANAQAFGCADICPFTRKPCDLVISPAVITEASYPTTVSGNINHLYPFSSGDSRFYTTYNGTVNFDDRTLVDTVSVATGAPIACVFVTGVAGSTFHVDLVFHLEYTGKTASASLTPNAVDVSSVYAILTAAQQLATRKMASPSSSNWALLMDGIRAAMGSPVMLTAKGIMKTLM